VTVSTGARRALCARCLRAQRSCICHWITPLVPVPQVLILQHPLEVHQAKGSGRLLQLSLRNSALQVGEQFDARQLAQWLFAPQGGAEGGAVQPLLLYPENDAADTGVSTTPLVTLAMASLAVSAIRLVVLDATWRKSRKMLYLNPLLQQLPRLALSDTPSSRYRIRKAHRPDQLSTLEATCYALAQLEGESARYQPLLAAFDGFVAQQSAYVPS